MQISKNQIDELYEFVKKKGIQYIDLQNELVGYLILIIESKMKSNPSLTFTKAFNLAYKTFGVYGFDAILSHKIKIQTKLFYRTIRKHIRALFISYRICFVLSSFFIFYYVRSFNCIIHELYFGFIAAAIFLLVYSSYSSHNTIRKLSKKYLVLSSYINLNFYSIFILYYFLVLPIVIGEHILNNYPYLFSINLTLLLVFIVVRRSLLKELLAYVKSKGLE
jgi:hypothetical protein